MLAMTYRAPKRVRADRKAEPKAVPEPPVVRLHREAVARGRSGDCAGVRTLAAKIRAVDARYHAREVLTDRALAACLGSAP